MARGFSLIEVMVSAAMLIVGLAAALTSYSTLTAALNHATHRSTAGVLAEQLLEEMVLRYPADPALVLGEHAGDETRRFDGNGKKTSGVAVYEVSWRVSPYAPLASIREVTAVVHWTDLQGEQALELTTWRN